MSGRTIYILMTVFNRSAMTKRCLAAVESAAACADLTELKVFVVDDGSTDDTAEVLSGFENVVVVHGGDLFWASGMALAEKVALQEHRAPNYFLWLNNDVVLRRGGIADLLQTSAQLGDEAIVVGATVDSQGALSYGGLRLPKSWRPLATSKVPLSDHVERADTMNGNVVLIPNSVHQDVGPIDGKFEHAFADLDYGLRATKRNVPVVVAPSWTGRCESNQEQTPGTSRFDSLKIEFSRKRQPIRSRYRYLRRHAGAAWPALLPAAYLKALARQPGRGRDGQ